MKKHYMTRARAAITKLDIRDRRIRMAIYRHERLHDLLAAAEARRAAHKTAAAAVIDSVLAA